MNTRTALRRMFEYFAAQDDDGEYVNGPGYRDDQCVYYANGTGAVRCAIGCLIPKQHQEAAGKIIGSVYVLLDSVFGLREVFKDVDFKVMLTTQEVHDDWASGNNTSRENFLAYILQLQAVYEAGERISP